MVTAEDPEGLGDQFARAPAFFAAFGWTSPTTTTLEADDLLGSLAAVEEQAGGARCSSPATATCTSARASARRCST